MNKLAGKIILITGGMGSAGQWLTVFCRLMSRK